MNAVDKRKQMQEAVKGLDSPASQVQIALSLATQVMWVNAPAFNTIRIVPRPGNKTFSIDPYYRVYVDYDIVTEWVKMAREVSAQKPCKTCGAKVHHELAYVAGALCHEVEHPLSVHHLRALALGVNGKPWNKATDKEINDGLLESFMWIHQREGKHLLCLPPGWVQHPQYDHQPMHQLAEEYYTLDQQKQQAQKPQPQQGQGQPQQGQGQPGQGQPQPSPSQPQDKKESDADGSDSADGDCGSGVDGLPRPWEEGPPTQQNPGVEQGEADAVRTQVAQNVAAARQAGSLPGNYGDWADKALRRPKKDYIAILKTTVRNSVNTIAGDADREYSKIHSQSWAGETIEVLIPGAVDNEVVVAVVQDVSGSMHGDAIDISRRETQGLLQQLGCRVRYYVADTEVKSEGFIDSIKQHKLTLGGGTDLTYAIRKAIKDAPRPQIVLCFTDGFTRHPERHEMKGAKLIYVLAGRYAAKDIPSWIKTVRVPA